MTVVKLNIIFAHYFQMQETLYQTISNTHLIRR